jgi:phosphate/sulfate permease
MNTIDQKNIKKIARILNIVFKFLFWTLVFAGSLLFIAEVVVIFIPEKHFIFNNLYQGNMLFKIEGLFEYDLAKEIGNSLVIKPIILVIIPAILVNILFYLINIKLIQSVLKTIKDDRPFDEKNAKSLFKMSMVFIAASIILEALGRKVFVVILETIGIEGISASLSINLTMLFTGVLLLVLSGVFRYGNYLQEEYDETV